MPSGRTTKKMYGTAGAPSGVEVAWALISSLATAATIGAERTPRRPDISTSEKVGPCG
jgi:hypothetical protein